MKFLIALTVLASVSAFAQGRGDDDKLKCYWTAQENGHQKPALVFEVEDRHDTFNRDIKLVYPERIELEQRHGCLVSREHGPGANDGYGFKVCEGEGQQVRRLVPIEIQFENREKTVWCEKGLLKFLGDDNTI